MAVRTDGKQPFLRDDEGNGVVRLEFEGPLQMERSFFNRGPFELLFWNFLIF